MFEIWSLWISDDDEEWEIYGYYSTHEKANRVLQELKSEDDETFYFIQSIKVK